MSRPKNYNKKLAKTISLTMMSLILLFILISSSVSVAADNSKNAVPPKLQIYTAMTATTAQLPLCGAIADGWPEERKIEINYWKNLDDLRGLLLAGQGDIWVGHLETLARAASRGAPVTLVAVTAWKKFYYLSAPRPEDGSYPADTEELASFLKATDQPLMVTPQNSPVEGILNFLAAHDGPQFKTSSLPPQQLMLELVNGQKKYALMPEPLVTSVLAKNPKLRIIGNLEEDYGKYTNSPSRLPQAGIAVNQKLIETDPDLVNTLILAMEKSSLELKDKSPDKLVDILPEEVQNSLGRMILEKSFQRDLIFFEKASAVRDEINQFLHLTAPELFPTDMQALLPESFIF